ncbi:MAG: ABC transporter permease subunit [Deltaproteobacteria bacterium]|nr:ABC transporter permease subunit [Deltaproteobacteria bacterium]
MTGSKHTERDQEIQRLYRERPRSGFLRWSAFASLLLVIFAWSKKELWNEEFFSERRSANFERFLGELRPYPLQGTDFDLGVAAAWAGDVLAEKGWTAAGITLAISVAAIVLAALGSLLLTFFATRTLATSAPYLPALGPVSRWRRWSWRIAVTASRGMLILMRSLPEYVLAFLLLAILGPNPWPIVLALALHNLGILGKLQAEVLEDLEPRPLAALRGLGASRLQIAAAGLFPLALPRFLLYFFYRWETCVREATVLGMLGIVSLGYWIVDARARNHYDEMFFFVLMGAAIVLMGDLISAVARAVVRRAA